MKNKMKAKALATLSMLGLMGAAFFAMPAAAATITIATVNNHGMIVMQKLSSQWEQQTGNHINWVVMQENVLRQKVTTDVATDSGLYDILTVGSYEVPLWAKQGWLKPLDNLGQDYDYSDLIPTVRKGLSYQG